MLTGVEYRQSLLNGRATYFEGRARRRPPPATRSSAVCVENVARGYDHSSYRPGADAVKPADQRIPRSA